MIFSLFFIKLDFLPCKYAPNILYFLKLLLKNLNKNKKKVKK